MRRRTERLRRARASAVRAVVFRLGVLLCLAAPAAAHPEHDEAGFFIDVHVTTGEEGVEALVRVPLGLLTGVGLPLRGARDVDVAAFRRPDPVADDGTTYAERAAGAVVRAFALMAGGERAALTPAAMRLSGTDPDPFTSASAAQAHIASGPAEELARITLHEGFLDLRLEGAPVTGSLIFAPTLGGAGSLVTFRLHPPGGAPRDVPGDGDPVSLGH